MILLKRQAAIVYTVCYMGLKAVSLPQKEHSMSMHMAGVGGKRILW